MRGVRRRRSLSLPLQLLALSALSLLPGAHAVDNGLLRAAPLAGWTTWCTDTLLPCRSDYCSEGEVMDVIDHMAANGLRALGYDYVLLDDCWAATKRDASSGEIRADTSRFPSGTLRPLADYAHARGFKLGAYTDVAARTCVGNRTGSGGHYAQDAATFARWQLDMVKMDWCGHDRSMSPQQIYTAAWRALNATGHPMVFYICEWGIDEPWRWAAPVSNMARTGPDHLPLWWTPETSQDPGVGQGTANLIQHAAGKSRYAQPGFWLDLDFLMTGEVWQSRIDDRTEFSFWCLLGSALLFATDPRDLTRKQALLNAEAIAINRDPLRIVGDLRRNDTNGAQVWTRPLAKRRWAAILYNSNIWFERVPPVTITFDASLLPGWPPSARAASVRDVWAHKDLGTFQRNFTTPTSLDVHECMFVVITPAST